MRQISRLKRFHFLFLYVFSIIQNFSLDSDLLSSLFKVFVFNNGLV